MESVVVKDETNIHEHYYMNTDIKQELNDLVPIQNIKNFGKLDNIRLIKQDVDDSNIVHTFEKYIVPYKTERNITKKSNTHIRNKLELSNLKRRRRSGSGLLKNGIDVRRNAGIMTCEFCGNVYVKEAELCWHFSLHHCLGKINKFHIGNKRKNRVRLFKNIREVVKSENEPAEVKLKHTNFFQLNVNSVNKKQFKCDMCTRYFGRKACLRNHLLSHTGGKPFKCDKCWKSYTQKGDLNRHLRSHTGEKPFKCDICTKSFTEKGYLNVHMRYHTGEKQFRCDICLKSFLRKSYLNAHARCHTGEKPFKCNVCSTSFSQISNLNRHLRSHFRENPFKCDICLELFQDIYDFNAHLGIHPRGNLFKCKDCSESFPDQRVYNNHLIYHTSDSPHKCDICFKTFTAKSNLHRHFKRSHDT